MHAYCMYLGGAHGRENLAVVRPEADDPTRHLAKLARANLVQHQKLLRGNVSAPALHFHARAPWSYCSPGLGLGLGVQRCARVYAPEFCSRGAGPRPIVGLTSWIGAGS
jgi:hypothetical protein